MIFLNHKVLKIFNLLNDTPRGPDPSKLKGGVRHYIHMSWYAVCQYRPPSLPQCPQMGY